jgi:hypothetical protein
MTDSTAPSSSRRLSSQEYIEQLRQRRMEKYAPAAPQPAPTVPQPATPVPEPELVPTPAPQPIEAVAPIVSTQEDPEEKARSLSEMLPDLQKPLIEETVLSWRAASRPFKKRDRQYYTTVAAIVFLISLILFFAGQFLPIAVVVSIGFLSYVLSSVPPEQIEHKITTYGVRLDQNLYYWEEMGRFWMEEKYGQPLAHIEIGRFPGRLTLVLGELTPQELRAILSEVLLEEKPKPTLYDKMAQWLQEKIPLEITGS